MHRVPYSPPTILCAQIFFRSQEKGSAQSRFPMCATCPLPPLHDDVPCREGKLKHERRCRHELAEGHAEIQVRANQQDVREGDAMGFLAADD